MADEKPKRMMARKDFKVLRDLAKQLEEKQEEMNDAITKLCDDHADRDWWPDKTNVALGFVTVTKEVSVERGGELISETITERQRIPPEERAPVKEIAKVIKDIRVRLEAKVLGVAIAACVPTKYVDVNTGEITAEKVTECDPAKEEGD